jgi:nucleotidyltransferase-like protein
MQTKLPFKIKNCLEDITKEFVNKFPVIAIAVGGSIGAGTADDTSDIDIYLYAKKVVPLDIRKKIIAPRANISMIGNQFWEPGDEWIEKDSGLEIDIIYRTTDWIENELDFVLEKHKAKVGYTTAFWFNVLRSISVYDSNNWFLKLQQKSNCKYPPQLKRNIIQKNYPILRKIQCSYKDQIEKAIDRKDLVSINHRIAVFLASYFDILFAINELPHPGEKRILEYAQTHCTFFPTKMKKNIETLLLSAFKDKSKLLMTIDLLVDELEAQL